MSEKLELGKYEFYPYELEDKGKTSEGIWEELKKLAEKFKRKDEKFADEFEKTKKRKAKKLK